MPLTCLYIHGFNSDGDGWKARALEQHFPEATILAPDFVADPKFVMVQLDNILSPLNPDKTLVFGTSLGGFYAYVCSAKYNVPAYLFNPSLEPYTTLDDRGIGQFYTWTKKRSYLFLAKYLLILKQLKLDADDNIDVKKLYFFLAKDDDVLDHSSLEKQYTSAQFEWFSKAGHSFSKFEKVLKAIKKTNKNLEF